MPWERSFFDLFEGAMNSRWITLSDPFACTYIYFMKYNIRPSQRVSVAALLFLVTIIGGAFAGGSQEAEDAQSASNGQSGSEVGPALSGLTTGQGEIATASETRVLQHELDVFRESMMSGGPPPDGIPSIDEPTFVNPDQIELDSGDPVIGLAYEGVVRAYPQRILVYHEIVNHEIGGENLAVTYCPLTATAQAFKSGSTTLGVSGRLVNSNLVMYDRDTGSLWPQIGGTAIAGERRGESLEEINVYWTTWGEWLERHPDTEVLGTDTGHIRNYERDPYGSYNPAGGYYTSERTLFPAIHTDDRYSAKRMVVGGRNSGRAVYFDLQALRSAGIQQTDHFLAVYEQELDTAYIYENAEAREFQYEEGRVIDPTSGDAFVPADLPLPSVIPIEGFYFAWIAFYPESEHPE